MSHLHSTQQTPLSYNFCSGFQNLNLILKVFHISQTYHDFALIGNDLRSDEQYLQTYYVHSIVPHSSECFDFASDTAEDHHLS